MNVQTRVNVQTRRLDVRCTDRFLEDLEALSCVYRCYKSDVLRKLVDKEVLCVQPLVDYSRCIK